jgi:hypothetical protein
MEKPPQAQAVRSPEAVQRQFAKLAQWAKPAQSRQSIFNRAGLHGIFEQNNGTNQRTHTQSNRGNRNIGNANEGKSRIPRHRKSSEKLPSSLENTCALQDF